MFCALNLEHALAIGSNMSECTNATDRGNVRLVDHDGQLTNEYGGRVEMCYKQTWMTVCDYRWGHKEAMVVCRQIGYNGNVSKG